MSLNRSRSIWRRVAIHLLSSFILFSGIPLVSQESAPEFFTLHYHREEGDYQGWGLHIWGAEVIYEKPITWSTPLMPTGVDDFGVYWKIPIVPNASSLNFIIHLGERKNTPNDVLVSIPRHGYEVWVLEGYPSLFSARPRLPGDPESPTASTEQSSAVSETGLTVEPSVLPSPSPTAAPRQAVGASALAAAAQAAREKALEEADAEKAQLSKEISSLEEELEEEIATARSTARIQNILVVISSIFLIAGLSGWILALGLKHRLRAERRKLSDKSREILHETETRLIQKSIHDELTGLTNRAGLNEALPQALTKARRYKRSVGLLFVDLDNFKPINDNLGHDAGDFVLRSISERFKDCVRESDLISRVGGDEFVILIEDLVDARFLGGIAQKLLSAAQQSFSVSGHEVHVSASIGIAIYPQDGRDSSSLLKNADAAMYEAKEHGRNNYRYFSAEQNIHALQRQALAASLGRALERKEFDLVYLPVLDMRSGAVATVDALARWKARDLGAIPPSQFIPLAEETGLMEELGGWILSTALEQGRRWRDGGMTAGISINISSRQLLKENFVEEIDKALADFRFPAHALTLEFTEECISVNPEESLDRLQGLKDLGVRILLDNFGVGLSSLSNLRRYPIDAIKLDRSIANGIPGDPENEGLAAAILAIGKNLGIDAIACGLEDETQRSAFAQAGWNFLQGFVHGKPLSSSDMYAFLGL